MDWPFLILLILVPLSGPISMFVYSRMRPATRKRMYRAAGRWIGILGIVLFACSLVLWLFMESQRDTWPIPAFGAGVVGWTQLVRSAMRYQAAHSNDD